MTVMTERSERMGFKLHTPSEWGIEPVPLTERKLGFLDFAVL